MAKRIKVTCIDNTGYSVYLTIGKEYEVYGEEQNLYYVKDDSGVMYGFYKQKFQEEEANTTIITVNEPSRTYHFPTKFGMKEVTVNNVNEVRMDKDGTHRLRTSDGTLEIIPAGWVRISIKGTEWVF